MGEELALLLLDVMPYLFFDHRDLRRKAFVVGVHAPELLEEHLRGVMLFEVLEQLLLEVGDGLADRWIERSPLPRCCATAGPR